MNHHKENSDIKFGCLTLLMTLSLVASWSAGVNAQDKSAYINNKNRVTFEPPAGDKPQQTLGGASRGEQCPANSLDLALPMTPLLPTASKALTTKSHPTMLVYIPQTSATKAMLAVRDRNEDYDYQTFVSIASDRAGIVSLTLPEDAPALAVDREYQWSLILMCDDKLRPDSPVAQGDIRRVATNVDLDINLDKKLSTANSLESAAKYAREGIWYDAVSTLAQLKLDRPSNEDISFNWQNLLQEVGLEEVAKAEFVE